MRGIHKVIVKNKRLHYEFELKRNITIIAGDSATGKSTLVGMIADYYNLGESSGIQFSCDKSCKIISGMDWKTQLETTKDSIVFIDEGNEFIFTIDFAREIKKSDNYYVIITRESIPSLPYSVEEIYGIRSSGKYKGLKQVYHEFYHIYSIDDNLTASKPELVLTEDSNSGFEFFYSVCDDRKISCCTAEGKTKIFSALTKSKARNILVVADGAAFGSEIGRIYEYISTRPNISLYLPESFEWLILSSDVINDSDVKTILAKPSDYIESSTYFSWEQYFTFLLATKSADTYLRYSKHKLNEAYVQPKIKGEIIKNILPLNI